MILKYSLFSISALAGSAAYFGKSAAFTTTPSSATSFSRRITTSTTSSTTTTTTTLHGALDKGWDNADFLSALGGGKDDLEKANEKYEKYSQNREAMDEWRAKKAAEAAAAAGEGASRAPSSSSSNGGGGVPGGSFAQPSVATPSMDSENNGPGGGPSPEFLRKMGLSGEEDLDQLRRQAPRGPPPMQAPPQFQPQPQQPPAQQPQHQQQQPQFYDANGNPISAMPMVYDQNGNLVPYNPQQQQLQPPPQMQNQQQQQQTTTPMQQPSNNNNIPIEPPLPPTTRPRETADRPTGFNPDAFAMANTADVYFAQLKRDSQVRKAAWLKGDKETANKVFADEQVKAIKDSWQDNPYTKEQNREDARRDIEGAVRMQFLDDTPQQVNSGISYKEKLRLMKAKRGGSVPASISNVVSTPPPPPQQSAAAAASVSAVPPPKMEPPAPVQMTPPKVVEVVQPVAPAVVSSPPPMAVTIPPPAAAAVAAAPSSAGDADDEEKRRNIRTLQGLLLKHRGGPGFGAGRLKGPEAQRLESMLEEVKSGLYAEAGLEYPQGEGGGTMAAAAPVVPLTPVMATPAAANPVVPSTPAAAVVPAQPAVDPMGGSVACVEAVLKMYKEASTPLEREAMLIPLREALMAAAGASTRVIAEQELSAHREAVASPVEQMAPPPAGMGFPSTYEVTKPVEEAVGGDNTRMLTDVYNALGNVSGSGKFGLKNISGAQADDLADKLVEMRGVLLDELNS